MKYALARFYRKNESYRRRAPFCDEVPGDAAKMGDPKPGGSSAASSRAGRSA
jgi:hypothetical protein